MFIAVACLTACSAEAEPRTTVQTDAAVDSGRSEVTVVADSGRSATDTSFGYCRWQSYGIGPVGMLQCSRQHLLAHAAVLCIELEGQPIEVKEVPGECVGEASEVIALCCFESAAPPPEEIPSGGPSRSLFERYESTAGRVSRTELVTEAGKVCVMRGQRLGDWSVIYGADLTSASVIRFYCL